MSLQQKYAECHQAWGYTVQLPVANLINRLARRIFLSPSDDLICEIIHKRLKKGKQPKLIIFTARYNWEWKRGARLYPLTIDNLNTGDAKYAKIYGILIPYKSLYYHLVLNGYRPICFTPKLLKLYHKDLAKLGFHNIKPGEIVFVPVCNKWP